MNLSIQNQLEPHWLDLVTIIVLGLAAAFCTYKLSIIIGPEIFNEDSINTWFDADIPRIYDNMTDRSSDHYRTEVHPLFSLITYPIVKILSTGLKLHPITAVRILTVFISAMWICSFYILLRLIKIRKLDSFVFTLLAISSASSLFWFSIPETYAFGSFSILMALILVVIVQQQHISKWWFIWISAATLSITVTNWMAGITAVILNHSWKQAFKITSTAFVIVLAFWIIQKLFFPSAEIPTLVGETKFLRNPDFTRILEVFYSFTFHTIVMPEFETSGLFNRVGWYLMYTQMSEPGSGSIYGKIAVTLWALLLVLSLCSLAMIKSNVKLKIFLILTLAGQLSLHILYGSETFLYSLHYLPLLLCFAALSTLTKLRLLALTLACLMLLANGINNYDQFLKVVDFIDQQSSPREQVLRQMRERPSDPWPQSKGHVILAIPGSEEAKKGYHEPGGNFSPAPDSFGVSIWLVDKKGNLKLNSDNLPQQNINQSFEWHDNSLIPAIRTVTDWYEIAWRSEGQGTWKLTFKDNQSDELTPFLVVRSVGPAGGPIRTLELSKNQLFVNNCWVIHFNVDPTNVYMGEEGTNNWINNNEITTEWISRKGWGYARVEIPTQAASWSASIVNTSSTNEEIITKNDTALYLELPDDEFVASMQAQISHMAMATVDDESRASDPLHNPFPWLREQSYQAVSFVRAGHLEIAKKLVNKLQESDFFGGFGPEADAPGLALWAFEEVASRVNQQEYDLSLWPHVTRKVNLIIEMLSTDKQIYKSYFGPVVPKYKNENNHYLLAKPSKNNLAIGKMDHHWPVLYINAICYRGLLDAAKLAERLNKTEQSVQWREIAEKIRQAWGKALLSSDKQNDRTYSSSLWPTWIAQSSTVNNFLLTNLDKRWHAKHDFNNSLKRTPAWTYFDIAEAHQWLYLNQPDRVWATLRWFWDHQASPGLFTWWEGNNEVNSYHTWERVRGWVAPPHVTPHYWTAAEMLALQLDMLVYTKNFDSDKPLIVIGAGVPKEWLKDPIVVNNLSVRNAGVNWSWDRGSVFVDITSEKSFEVELGPAFPQSTQVHVRHMSTQR